MARPRKGQEKDRPHHLGFRTAASLYAAIHRLAQHRKQPVSEVAHDLLEKALPSGDEDDIEADVDPDPGDRKPGSRETELRKLVYERLVEGLVVLVLRHRSILTDALLREVFEEFLLKRKKVRLADEPKRKPRAKKGRK